MSTEQHESKAGTPLAEPTGYAPSIRRWNFTNRGGEIWVCEGDHEKCKSCTTHSREVFAAEAIKIIEDLRSENLRLSLHNVSNDGLGRSEADER